MNMTDEHLISLQPGTVIGGKYEVVKCLGSGSMGLVYACRNRELMGQMVAVKVLFPEVAADKVASARFRNEVLASYEVSHPNVVRAYDLLRDGDLVAYTMEFVGGGDLAERLSGSERMQVSEVVRLMAQMAAGLQAIHEAGIVHRDMKPENILLTKEGNVKIADFGIARNRHGPKLTEHGGVVGTVEYVAPEYMLKSHVDWRSDIYALGILAYEMVTGEAPFTGDSVYATMTKRLKSDPNPPSALRSDCPAELDAVILKAMHRDPEQRYQSGQDVYDDLKAIAKAHGYKMGPAAATRPRTATGTFVGPSLVDPLIDAPAPASSSSPLPTPSVSPDSLRRAPQSAVFAGTASQNAGASERVSASGDVATAERGRSAGTEVLTSGFVDFAVETDAPIGMTEPPRIQPAMSKGVDLVSDTWDSEGSFEAPAQVSARLRSLSQRYVEKDHEQLSVRDVVALGLAALIGIACGLVFLRMVAPSLLSGINF